MFAAIRKQFPSLPVAFAGMLDVPMASNTIKRMLSHFAGTSHVIGVETGNDHRTELGQATSFVYLRNSDLSTPDKAKTAARILQSHFK